MQDFLFIKHCGEYLKLPFSEIVYVEAVNKYVKVITKKGSYLISTTMCNLEKMLPEKTFRRIHRSYILNIDRLAKLELYAKDSHAAILRDGTRLPVSRSGYARLNSVLR